MGANGQGRFNAEDAESAEGGPGQRYFSASSASSAFKVLG